MKVTFVQIKGLVKKSGLIFKILSLSSLATFIKTLTSFIIGKLAAIWLGPSGIALMGQLGNSVAILNTFGSGLLEGGTTAMVAKSQKDPKLNNKNLSNIFVISACFSALFGLLTIVFATQLNESIFPGYSYNHFFHLAGIFVFFSALNNLFSAIINGFQQFKQLIILNISCNIFVFILTIVCMYFYGLDGAFLTIIIAQPICFFLAYYVLKNIIGIVNIRYTWSNFHFDNVSKKTFVKYIIMGLFSNVLMPLTSFLVRSIIIHFRNIEVAGFWESISKIGAMYSSFITIGITFYFYPLISTLENFDEIKKQIIKFCITLLPPFILGCFVIYYLKEFVTVFVFTKAFAPINELYAFQLLGEVLKVVAWLFGMVLWAKQRLWDFLISQGIYALCFTGCCYLLAPTFGAKAGTISFAIASGVFLFTLILLFINAQKNANEKSFIA